MATVRRRRPPVVTTYTPAALLASRLGDYITQPEPTGDGEMRMFCPICEVPGESRTPSASINPRLGKWHCLGKCSEGGSILALTQQLGVKIRGSASRESTAKKKPALPPPLEDQHKPLDWHDKFMRGECADFLDFLTQERGLHPNTLAHFHVGADGERVTIPIYVRGRCINVRRYLPHAPNAKRKMLNLPGHGSPAVLAFTETLAGNSLPVVVTEGELDALLVWQEAAGRLAVVTGTGGAGTPPPDLSALRGREVWVAYDNDDAGRKGAEKFTARAKAAGAHAHVLDLARLGLSGDGADVSDYLLRCGKVDALLAEMERLRSAPEAGVDEVATAMEAAFLDLGAPQTEYTAALLSEDDILTAPPLRYVVEPWLPVGMFTSMFGQPGSGKTFVGQDLQNAVRAGIPWHGHDVAPGAVLLLEAEGVQQLQARIVAWNEHHGNPDMAAFRALDVPLDLSTPEGAAALVRTVRGMEAATGERVVLVWIDPAALYMSSSENEDGNRNLALGLNAVAKYLDIAVLVIVHTNAEGSRARGTDHFRMLSGSHIRVERIDGDMVGVVQEKVKNTSPRAVILRPVQIGRSLAFDTEERMSALDYASRKDRAAWTSKVTHRLSEATTAHEVKTSHAEALILDVLATRPRQSTTQIVAATQGQGVGSDGIKAALASMVERGVVATEPGPRKATLHTLADLAEGAEK
ncbi:bifunctional DNA primase/helicase [Protaetiibacter larvae]|uniref:AAA family ATPase n=1 Tax=Protaetiibacter larvae TaxID=2592654 RepID=A0A5C1Y520_9MICO|nr:bifunctional DNA primase/helicase [Protaetiibacter larvae]QEO08800.1 AAA family ATPase [Protaetiibacter larvae]